MKRKILIVDDEQAIADLVEVYLSNEGMEVLKCYNGKDALDCIRKEELSLAILDVMLPDIDGYKLCQEIRKEHFYPVIMLTARTEDTDKILGLTIGADDYITKPFNPLELVARVKTQLRRFERYNPKAAPADSSLDAAVDSCIDIRGLSIDKDFHKCSLNGSPLSLTPIEFSILWYLCENKGRVVSSEELFEQVWGEKFLDNKEIGKVAFQFGTRPIVTQENPAPIELKKTFLNLEEGDVKTNQFSPTGFWSSAINNDFLQDQSITEDQKELNEGLTEAEIIELSVDKTVDLMISGLAERITSENLIKCEGKIRLHTTGRPVVS